MATDEVVLEGGSRFLNKFIINQAKGALGGSGDDRYYYDQVISYFKKQPTVWIEFEKQARAEGHKEEREKVRCMGANCEKPPVWCNYAYHEQFEKGKKAGRDESKVCTEKCLDEHDHIKALETEKEHLIKQVEQLKYGESAGFKYNHSHPYPLCQGCVTEGREEAEKAFTTPIRKYIEAIATQCERIKALEAERTVDTKTMCENAKGMTYWMGEAERYKATLEKVRERLAGFQQEAKCKCEEFDDCYECWVRSEAKDLDKLAKEALGNCGSADGIGCEEQQTTRLSDSKCQRKGSWQPHSKRKNIVSFPTSFGTVSFPKPRKVKKK